MDISKKLEELWMVQLPKNKEVNDFAKVVTFVLPDYVSEILAKKYKTKQSPQIVIIRKWVVKGKWIRIERQEPKKLMSYSLAYFDEEDEKFRIVKDEVWKSVKRVLWSMTAYVTWMWDLYTASKYLHTTID